MPRRELTAEEVQWKDNLLKVWNRKKIELGLNQERLAESMGWSSQGSVGQYLTGRIPLNTDAKYKFADALGVSASLIDPDLPVRPAKTPKNADEFMAQFEDGLRDFPHEEQLKLASQILQMASESK